VLAYLLDTDICITVLRDRPAGLRPTFAAEADRLAISTVTLGELLYGAARSNRPADHRAAVDGFANRLTVLPFDAAAAAQFARIRADLAARGQQIGGYDLMIAAAARSRGLTLVTHNRREFDRVAGLAVVDWLAEGG
jgi:tRNA(fMet)-specific endonuclease VapC